MTEDDTSAVRCWLVERTFGDEDMVTLVYATPDGAYSHRRQCAMSLLLQNPATAAIEVAEADLDAVADETTQERYAGEAARVAEGNDPDDEV